MTLKPKIAKKKTRMSTRKSEQISMFPPNKVLELTDDMISEYLFLHPEFFIRNAQQIEKMKIPHPVRGVVSLSEWQLARQRTKINQLECEISMLMEHAMANEKLFEQFMSIQSELLKAESLTDLAKKLNAWAVSLGLLGAHIHLFDDKWHLSAPSNAHQFALSTKKFDFIRVRHLQYRYHYLGHLNQSELTLLVPGQSYVGSVALSLLGRFGDLGLLVFSSRNPNHYQAEQGTLLLEKIRKLLPILISRWVTRKK